jgi:hypothetical protein
MLELQISLRFLYTVQQSSWFLSSFGLKEKSPRALNRAYPIPVHTAIIWKLAIGKAAFRNVAVLVVEDKDMFVPALQYSLPGSLGFPVLSALRQITFLRGR